MNTEHKIQNDIRNALDFEPDIHIFRANVASGWFGHWSKFGNTVRINNPRFLSTGLPKGFPDLFGYVSKTITKDMVGKTFAHFAFLEVKSPNGKPSKEQLELQRQFLDDGAIGGIVRSVQDSLIILRGDFK